MGEIGDRFEILLITSWSTESLDPTKKLQITVRRRYSDNYPFYNSKSMYHSSSLAFRAWMLSWLEGWLMVSWWRTSAQSWVLFPLLGCNRIYKIYNEYIDVHRATMGRVPPDLPGHGGQQSRPNCYWGTWSVYTISSWPSWKDQLTMCPWSVGKIATAAMLLLVTTEKSLSCI